MDPYGKPFAGKTTPSSVASLFANRALAGLPRNTTRSSLHHITPRHSDAFLTSLTLTSRLTTRCSAFGS
jgi:hypothetical protein